MGLFAVLLNKKLVRENRTMKNYKIAVAGTGFDGLSCPSKVLFVKQLQEAGNPEGYM